MNFYKNKKSLPLLILGGLMMGNNAYGSLPFMKTTVNVNNLSQTVITKGQEELCKSGGEFRKLRGDRCKKDSDIARLSLVVCKDVNDFNASECYDNAITVLGYKQVREAKQDIIKDLSTNPTYNAFFCGAAQSKFVGHLKAIADQCKTQPVSNKTDSQKENASNRTRSNAISVR